MSFLFLKINLVRFSAEKEPKHIISQTENSIFRLKT